MSHPIQGPLSKQSNKKPSVSIAETRAETTHKIATAINESEYAKRVAKTLRLKNERLAQADISTPAQANKGKSKNVLKKAKSA